MDHVNGPPEQVQPAQPAGGMPRRLWEHRALILACGLALVLRLAISVPLHREAFTSDEKEYLFLANRMAHGQDFQDSNGEWSVKPPGFPALLAAMFWTFGNTLIPLFLLNAAVGAMAAALGFAIVHRITGDRVAASWTAGALALHPSLVIYGAVLQSEAVYIALMLAAVLIAVRMVREPSGGRSVLLGVLLVATIFTRAIGLAVAAALLLGLLLAMEAPLKRRLVTVGIAGIVVVAGLIPWTVRNYSIHHAYVPVSTFAGTSLLLGNNPYSKGTMALPPAYRDWVRSEAARRGYPDPDSMTETGREHVQEEIAVGWITSHPADWARLLVRKMHVFWIFPVTTTADSHPIQAVALAGDAVLWLGSLAGFLVLWTKRREVLPVVFVIFVVTAAHVAMHTEARYRLPLVALLALFFGPGMAALVGSHRRELFRQRGPGRVVVATLAGLLVLGYAYAGVLFLHGEV